VKPKFEWMTLIDQSTTSGDHLTPYWMDSGANADNRTFPYLSDVKVVRAIGSMRPYNYLGCICIGAITISGVDGSVVEPWLAIPFTPIQGFTFDVKVNRWLRADTDAALKELLTKVTYVGLEGSGQAPDIAMRVLLQIN
jgi:hypothetical protein